MPAPASPDWVHTLEVRIGSAGKPAADEAAAWLAQAPADADPVLVRRLRLLVALRESRVGRIGDGVQAIRDIRDWAVEHHQPYLQARAERLLSTLLRLAGETAVSLEHAVAAVDLLPPDTPDVVRGDALVGLGDALSINGSVDEAVSRYRTGLRLFTRGGYWTSLLMGLNNLAYTYYEAGRFDDATECASQILATNAEQGLPLTLHAADTIASIYLATGRGEEAMALFGQVDLTAALAQEDIAQVRLTQARVLRQRGDLVGADAELQRCLEFCDEHDLGAVSVPALQERAELFAARGRFEDAFVQYRAFHERYLSQQRARSEARARMMQAIFEAEEARRESARFRELSYRDSLTRLYNRRYVDEHLAPLLAERSAQRRSVAVAFIDLDHFKSVNDTYSHEVGDEVLRRLAGVLEAAGADVPDGFAARMGGEEFLLVLPDCDRDGAVPRLERVRREVERTDLSDLAPALRVTVSIGCAVLPVDAGDRLTLLARADQRLYAAKRTGRNRVVSEDDDPRDDDPHAAVLCEA